MGVLFSSGPTGGLTDGQLLDRFANRHDAPDEAEAAFATLVDRHGSLVWGICQRTLGDYHGAEDAFQATFLILARQGASLWVDESLGGWLRRVATRVACRARAEARRHPVGADAERLPADGDSCQIAEREDLRAAIATELSRIPGKFRAPVELCHLRGLTQDEAARLLDLPVGTVKSRLDRGKRRLREALTRRGLAPAITIASASPGTRIPAALPASLARSTLQLAMAQSGGVRVASASVAALASLSTGHALVAKHSLLLGLAFAATSIATCGLVLTAHGTTWTPSDSALPSPPQATKAASLPPPASPSPRRPTPPDVTGLLTSRDEPEAPETNLGEAILKELRAERR